MSAHANGGATAAGILQGDLITRLDDTPTAGMSLDEFVTAAQGPAGSLVQLTVLRNQQELALTVTRALLELPTQPPATFTPVETPAAPPP